MDTDGNAMLPFGDPDSLGEALVDEHIVDLSDSAHHSEDPLLNLLDGIANAIEIAVKKAKGHRDKDYLLGWLKFAEELRDAASPERFGYE